MTPRPVSWLPGQPEWPSWSPYELHLALALSAGLVFVLMAPSLLRVARWRLLAVSVVTALAGLLGALWLPWLVAGAPTFERVADLQLVAYAGVAGGVVAAVLGARLLSVPLHPLLDVLAPAGALGLAVARIGCFVAGCDFGLPWSAWASVRYPAWAMAGEARVASAALLDHIARARVSDDAILSAPVHPVQLYESLLGLTLFAVLLHLGPRRDGLRVGVLALGYGVGRFFLEALRGDADRGVQVWGTPFSSSQCVSLAVVVVAVAVFAWRARRSNALI